MSHADKNIFFSNCSFFLTLSTKCSTDYLQCVLLLITATEDTSWRLSDLWVCYLPSWNRNLDFDVNICVIAHRYSNPTKTATTKKKKVWLISCSWEIQCRSSGERWCKRCSPGTRCRWARQRWLACRLMLWEAEPSEWAERTDEEVREMSESWRNQTHYGAKVV